MQMNGTSHFASSLHDFRFNALVEAGFSLLVPASLSVALGQIPTLYFCFSSSSFRRLLLVSRILSYPLLYFVFASKLFVLNRDMMQTSV
jgi:hypothetical protein